MTEISYQLNTHVDSSKTEIDCFFFLHGWPDSTDLFEPYVSQFITYGKQHKKQIACYNCAFPNFPQSFQIKEENKNVKHLSLMKVANMVADLIVKTHAEWKETYETVRITFIGHDWGAIIGYFITHQDFPIRVPIYCFVPISVAPNKSRLPCFTYAYVTCYQSILCLFPSTCVVPCMAWCLGRPTKLLGSVLRRGKGTTWPYRSMCHDVTCHGGKHSLRFFQSYVPSPHIILLFVREDPMRRYQTISDPKWESLVKVAHPKSQVFLVHATTHKHWIVRTHQDEIITKIFSVVFESAKETTL